MSKFFNEKPSIKRTKEDIDGLEVIIQNIDKFPKAVRPFIRDDEAGKLIKGNSARVNQLICEPENDNEFTCEALIDSKVGPKGKKIIAEDQVVEISNADTIGIHSKNNELDDGVLYID